VSDWRDYEFKAMLSKLQPIEQGETIGAIVARWLKRSRSRRRVWQFDSVYPVIWVLG
jgi:hypothetical protein